ncbi:hypothetical protein LOK49_LG09G01485 [Camellia lanceoleosa]|uniref:Uncharacterized protein n=1 Tax=Camellia lanceoleosa TaxID=1840588 RepID=A0ACC0GLM3_9ERIC|nr:hypothetical protein LOK49_LG09G01485 [Camellia lanceoleosa]
MFTYLYSTAKNPMDEWSELGTTNVATMAGYGYEISISRLYTRYFGGDLQTISIEGYEAVADAKKAIELDPVMAKDFLADDWVVAFGANLVRI